MAYTTQAKVQSLFRKLEVDTDTAVTTAEITQFIEDAEAEINARLAEYYVVPITGTESLKIVDTIAKYKVAHVVKMILAQTVIESDKVQEIQENWGMKAEQMLKAITPEFNCQSKCYKKATMPLPDAVEKDFAPKNSSIMTAPTLVPTFEKGGDNW